MTFALREYLVVFEMPPQQHQITARTHARNIDHARRLIEQIHPGCKIVTAYPVPRDANLRKAKNKYETY